MATFDQARINGRAIALSFFAISKLLESTPIHKSVDKRPIFELYTFSFFKFGVKNRAICHPDNRGGMRNSLIR